MIFSILISIVWFLCGESFATEPQLDLYVVELPPSRKVEISFNNGRPLEVAQVENEELFDHLDGIQRASLARITRKMESEVRTLVHRSGGTVLFDPGAHLALFVMDSLRAEIVSDRVLAKGYLIHRLTSLSSIEGSTNVRQFMANSRVESRDGNRVDANGQWNLLSISGLDRRINFLFSLIDEFNEISDLTRSEYSSIWTLSCRTVDQLNLILTLLESKVNELGRGWLSKFVVRKVEGLVLRLLKLNLNLTMRFSQASHDWPKLLTAGNGVGVRLFLQDIRIGPKLYKTIFDGIAEFESFYVNRYHERRDRGIPPDFLSLLATDDLLVRQEMGEKLADFLVGLSKRKFIYNDKAERRSQRFAEIYSSENGWSEASLIHLPTFSIWLEVLSQPSFFEGRGIDRKASKVSWVQAAVDVFTRAIPLLQSREDRLYVAWHARNLINRIRDPMAANLNARLYGVDKLTELVTENIGKNLVYDQSPCEAVLKTLIPASVFSSNP